MAKCQPQPSCSQFPEFSVPESAALRALRAGCDTGGGDEEEGDEDDDERGGEDGDEIEV